MTAPENFSSIPNIPLIAERRPDMTVPTIHILRLGAIPARSVFDQLEDGTKTQASRSLIYN